MPNEHPNDSRPHFVVPYWSSTGVGDPGDDGDTRPVPGNVVWYLCPSIQASAYTPGERLDVKVTIGNHGGANTPSIAQVTVWWAEPSAGFVIGPDKLIGYVTVPVDGRGGLATTATLSKTIPDTAPEHICLLARVSHQYDRAGSVADPVNDRHWAQRNIAVVTYQPGVPVVFPFLVGNPFEEETMFDVTVRPASEERFDALGQALEAEPAMFEARLLLSEEDGRRQLDGREGLRIGLAGLEQRRLSVEVELFGDLDRGQVAVIEVSQRDERRELVVGGLAIALTAG